MFYGGYEMLIKDLIEKLQEYDEYLEVVTADLMKIEEIYLRKDNDQNENVVVID